MSYIAGFPLYIIGGKLARIGLVSEDISRKGVNGLAFRRDSLKSRSVRIDTFADFNNAAAAEVAILAYKALQAYTVTVIDEVGRQYDNVMVRWVDPVGTNVTGTAVGGLASAVTGRVNVNTRWVLQTTEI